MFLKSWAGESEGSWALTHLILDLVCNLEVSIISSFTVSTILLRMHFVDLSMCGRSVGYGSPCTPSVFFFTHEMVRKDDPLSAFTYASSDLWPASHELEVWTRCLHGVLIILFSLFGVNELLLCLTVVHFSFTVQLVVLKCWIYAHGGVVVHFYGYLLCAGCHDQNLTSLLNTYHWPVGWKQDIFGSVWSIG